MWLEKDALAGVLVETTDAWDIALMVTRGVSSDTFLHPAVMDANESFEVADVSTIILLLFDFDAGGARAAAKVHRHFDTHGTAPVEFVDVAVTEEQIADLALPTRPAKKSDPQAADWGDVAVELDAIPPDTLRALVQNEITKRIDSHAWEFARQYEEGERGLLERIAEEWVTSATSRSSSGASRRRSARSAGRSPAPTATGARDSQYLSGQTTPGRYRFQCVDAVNGDTCGNESDLVRMLGLTDGEIRLNGSKTAAVTIGADGGYGSRRSPTSRRSASNGSNRN